MSSPTPEARAKIADSLRRYYANNPSAQAKLRENGRKGGRATTSKKAQAEAESVVLRAAFLALRMECDQLHAELVATREALTRAESALEAARAEVARLRELLA